MSSKNAKMLRKALAEFIEVARPVKAPRNAKALRVALAQQQARSGGRASRLRESRKITPATHS